MQKELSGLQSNKSLLQDKDYLHNIQLNINRLKAKTKKSSLKQALQKIKLDIDEDAFPPPSEHNEKTNQVLYSLFEHDKSTMAYTGGGFHTNRQMEINI